MIRIIATCSLHGRGKHHVGYDYSIDVNKLYPNHLMIRTRIIIPLYK